LPDPPHGYPADIRDEEALMAATRREATPQRQPGLGGISAGGVIVIIGIVVALFWSLLLGIIIILIGLLAFGGFARGRWY
jgi:hypothetical protein